MGAQNNLTPPYNTRYIEDNSDLPQNYSKGRFLVSKMNGETFEFVADKRKRQILEALVAGPIYSASRIRLGQAVMDLRSDGVDIHTERYTGKSGPLSTRYGVYWLNSKISYLGGATPKAGDV